MIRLASRLASLEKKRREKLSASMKIKTITQSLIVGLDDGFIIGLNQDVFVPRHYMPEDVDRHVIPQLIEMGYDLSEMTPGLFVPLREINEEEFAIRCRNQQIELLARCAAFEAELGLAEEADETPKLPGAGDAQAPLKPGQKRAKYIHTTDEKGREVEIEVATGIRRLVK